MYTFKSISHKCYTTTYTSLTDEGRDGLCLCALSGQRLYCAGRWLFLLNMKWWEIGSEYIYIYIFVSPRKNSMRQFLDINVIFSSVLVSFTEENNHLGTQGFSPSTTLFCHWSFATWDKLTIPNLGVTWLHVSPVISLVLYIECNYIGLIYRVQ